jgi:HPt (histidine-containing phosphotransfer) domain-containing protein
VSNDGKSPRRIVTPSPAAIALLPKFLDHRRRDVATIRTALDVGDFEAIRRIGHNMRGNGLSYGFPGISAIGERLETEASVRNAPGVLEQLAALEAALARIGEGGATETTPRTESGTRVRAAPGDPEGADKKSGAS